MSTVDWDKCYSTLGSAVDTNSEEHSQRQMSFVENYTDLLARNQQSDRRTKWT